MKRFTFQKRMRRQTGNRRALTVVELLAATVLAAMLMVAVLGVLQAMTRGQKALFKTQTSEPWQTRFVDQIEWDLTNSQSIQAAADGFLLTGFAGRDFASGTAVHARSEIHYSVIEEDEQTCLIRRETHPDSLNLDNSLAEIVCTEIEKIVIAAVASEETLTDENNSSFDITRVPDGPLPDRLIVALYRTGETSPVFQHVFVLR